jgi:hypothetical protein
MRHGHADLSCAAGGGARQSAPQAGATTATEALREFAMPDAITVRRQ